jgi:hypothetical protein
MLIALHKIMLKSFFILINNQSILLGYTKRQLCCSAVHKQT